MIWFCLYGKKPAFNLIDLTHQDRTPWSNHYEKGLNIELPKDEIINYYQSIVDRKISYAVMLSKEEISLTINLAETLFKGVKQYKKDPFPKCTDEKIDDLYNCCLRVENNYGVDK